MIKLNVRGKSISYSSHKAKINRLNESELVKKINTLEESLLSTNNGNCNDIANEIDNIKKQLQLIREPKIKASMLRARVEIYEEGEKPSKYFCNLEKRNYINKTISKLQCNNNMITDPKCILKEQKNFYQNLYTSKLKTKSPFFTKIFNQGKYSDIDRQFEVKMRWTYFRK